MTDGDIKVRLERLHRLKGKKGCKKNGEIFTGCQVCSTLRDRLRLESREGSSAHSDND